MNDLRDYVASGYFLSRHTGARDFTATELRRVTLATDHSPRKFFPGSWALSWCRSSLEERLEEAAAFGIAQRQLDDVTVWADRSFNTVFGAWSVFFELAAARGTARLFLRNAAGLDLWGVSLHRTLVDEYCLASTPPPATPGHAPTGASGVHVATCERRTPLADGGEVLGHEILIDDLGCCFNSPESRHVDERALLAAAGVVPNRHGLIDSFDGALACCRHLDLHANAGEQPITGWRPWLIVTYPLGTVTSAMNRAMAAHDSTLLKLAK